MARIANPRHRGELRDAWFTKEQINANTEKVEVLTENGFNEKE